MDPTVPRSAAILLDFIGTVETGKKPPVAYETLFAHRQNRLAKPLISMTVDEVIAAGANWSRWEKPASSAAGRYQFMRATLTDLKRTEKLTGKERLTPNLQDRLGFALLKRRGYESFMSGTIDATDFGKRLAMEWASLPVMATTEGAHRQVNRGQSYYAGDGINKALVAPERVEAVLAEALHAARPQPDDPGIDPGDKPPSGINWPIILIFAALAIAGAVSIPNLF